MLDEDISDAYLRRKSLRHLSSQSVAYSDLDDFGRQATQSAESAALEKAARHSKRRQMRKDLDKLKRCMARTGVAAVAASMLGGSGDGLASMDQASRFRRRHRPPIPELYPELYPDDDYSALADRIRK